MKHSLLALSSLSFVSALHLPLRQTKRASSASATSSSGGLIALSDNQDMIYLVNMTVAGQPYIMQLDTGSSDLWITVPEGSIPGQGTNMNLNLTYGVGHAFGTIATAEVTFANITIPHQAYLAAQQVDNPATSYGAQGIMGASFTSISSIDSSVSGTGESWGRSLLYNMFSLNRSEPNIMSVMLERVNDLNNQTQGSLSIGEVDSRYAGVVNTAPIPTFPPQKATQWLIVVDNIAINGNNVSVSSSVPKAPTGKGIALLDSGTSVAFAPSNVVDAMYSKVPGAEFSSSTGQWLLPCNAEVDVSITINKRQFDIHPLDTVQPITSGSGTCIGSWYPKSSLAVGDTQYDFIFGDVILRSMYAVFDYGSFTPTGTLGDPSVKLWSLVNGSEASQEFNTVRGGSSTSRFPSNDNVNSPSSNANSSSSNAGTSSSDISDLQTKVHNITKWAPLAIGVAALNVVVMLVVLVVSIVGCVSRRRRNQRFAPSGSFVPLPLGASSHNYQRVSLQEMPKHHSERYND